MSAVEILIWITAMCGVIMGVLTWRRLCRVVAHQRAHCGHGVALARLVMVLDDAGFALPDDLREVAELERTVESKIAAEEAAELDTPGWYLDDDGPR